MRCTRGWVTNLRASHSTPNIFISHAFGAYESFRLTQSSSSCLPDTHALALDWCVMLSCFLGLHMLVSGLYGTFASYVFSIIFPVASRSDLLAPTSHGRSRSRAGEHTLTQTLALLQSRTQIVDLEEELTAVKMENEHLAQDNQFLEQSLQERVSDAHRLCTCRSSLPSLHNVYAPLALYFAYPYS